MKILGKIAAARKFCQSARKPLVFVPTMGALHEGHASLIRKARKLAGKKGTVVVSIFVNATQFGPKEDFSRYPRPVRADNALCRSLGANMVFRPSAQEMYFEGRSIWVEETQLSRVLCGASRPGHFRGVCTVVSKLFNILAPDIAIFGEKDWQQITLIRRMVRDLNFPVRIVGAPIVREADGLALSSRNRYLTAEQRHTAPGLYQALREARALRRSGEQGASVLLSFVKKAIARLPGARLDYAEVVDSETLERVRTVGKRSATLAIAVFFGKTRLIDNIRLSRR